MDEQLIEDLTNYLEDDAETARMIPLSVKRAIRSFKKKQGAEFQGSHSESSVNRNWTSETEIYVNHGVFPFIGF